MCLCEVALSCSHCDVKVVNWTLQVRRIGYRSAVALSSPMLQITADVPVSDVRHHYQSHTIVKFFFFFCKIRLTRPIRIRFLPSHIVVRPIHHCWLGRSHWSMCDRCDSQMVVRRGITCMLTGFWHTVESFESCVCLACSFIQYTQDTSCNAVEAICEWVGLHWWELHASVDTN